jgi:uncharacterized repeat protein (TIGR03843 family)
MGIADSELEVIGRLVDASNASLLCKLENGEQVIYKPIAGERPLWDFPDGNLASREVAAFYISELGNFNIVPKTVLRDGPFGIGAVQEWVDIDEDFDVTSCAQSANLQIREMALFDALVNNADRKFGHILYVDEQKIFGCDHGVTFHEENKLRTVLWQFADSELMPGEILKIEKCLDLIDEKYLTTLITSKEIDSLRNRGRQLIELGKFPIPNPNWPPVPWPPY